MYDEIVGNIGNNFHKKYGNLYLNENQFQILISHNIDYKNFKSNKELIIYLEQYLNISENEELEQLSLELSELEYYTRTNK